MLPSVFVRLKLLHLFSFQAPTPLKNQVRSWKCYCANTRLRITLIRTLTYLYQEPTEKGSLQFGNSAWARNGNTSLKCPSWDAHLGFEEGVKTSSSHLSWLCVVGKLSKGTASTCRRQFEISGVIGTVVFPEVIKSLEMESYKVRKLFILLGQYPQDLIILKTL